MALDFKEKSTQDIFTAINALYESYETLLFKETNGQYKSEEKKDKSYVDFQWYEDVNKIHWGLLNILKKIPKQRYDESFFEDWRSNDPKDKSKISQEVTKKLQAAVSPSAQKIDAMSKLITIIEGLFDRKDYFVLTNKIKQAREMPIEAIGNVIEAMRMVQETVQDKKKKGSKPQFFKGTENVELATEQLKARMKDLDSCVAQMSNIQTGLGAWPKAELEKLSASIRKLEAGICITYRAELDGIEIAGKKVLEQLVDLLDRLNVRVSSYNPPDQIYMLS
jgi:hypothetical protein